MVPRSQPTRLALPPPSEHWAPGATFHPTPAARFMVPQLELEISFGSYQNPHRCPEPTGGGGANPQLASCLLSSSRGADPAPLPATPHAALAVAVTRELELKPTSGAKKSCCCPW